MFLLCLFFLLELLCVRRFAILNIYYQHVLCCDRGVVFDWVLLSPLYMCPFVLLCGGVMLCLLCVFMLSGLKCCVFLF